MKTELHRLSFILMLLALFITLLNLNAQVTIGSNIAPNQGALLDLKEEDTTGGEANSKRGLGLPRVKITGKYTLKDVIEGYETLSDTDKKNLSKSHIGLIVYNMDQFIYDQCSISQSGVMVWTGDEGWESILRYQGEFQGDLTTRRADSLALVKIYNETDGDNWSAGVKKNWKSEKPLHEWGGVVIEKNSDGTSKLCGRVVELSFMNGKLKGAIPNDIWNLTALKTLRLSYNADASIALADGLGKLEKLEVLYMSKIKISDRKIPPSIGKLSNLRVLYLDDNAQSLAGSPLPAEIVNLKNITEIELSKNDLTGTIPTGIVNLAKLNYLNLSRNSLTGPIPEDIGNLTMLGSTGRSTLDLSYNKLSGKIPTSIGLLTNLRTANMNNNNLTGEIPAEMGNMAALKVVKLTKNNLSSISPQFAINAANNGSAIEEFRADSNQIVNLPKELALMSNLNLIDLSVNAIDHDIPVEIATISSLKHLILNDNRITGSIPVGLGSCTELIYLALQKNRLTGGIPQELGNASKITHLNLSYNIGLKGELPSSLGNLTNMIDFRIEQCGLTGTIPSSFANLTQLKTFNVSQNDMEGSLPTFFVNFSSLTSLKLHTCKFEGEIPTAYNGLKNINNAKFEFEIQLNYLSGNVPANIISLVNRQPSLSQATEDNPVRAKICPQYNASGSVIDKPFNNFDACMSKP